MKKILLLLSEGFEFYEASVFIDVVGWNLLDGDGSTELFTCGLDKIIPSAFNQKMIVDYLIEDINVDEYDVLAIPGGFEEYHFWEASYNNSTLALIKEFHSKNKIIASICVGALVLGKSGILKDKNATTYNNPVRRESLAGFGANVVENPIVIHEKIITSWNPSTAIDVALLVLEWLTSSQNAQNIRKKMGF